MLRRVVCLGARVVSAAVGRAPVFAVTASAGAAAIAGLVVATEEASAPKPAKKGKRAAAAVVAEAEAAEEGEGEGAETPAPPAPPKKAPVRELGAVDEDDEDNEEEPETDADDDDEVAHTLHSAAFTPVTDFVDISGYPVVEGHPTHAPRVPPPITRKHPARVKVTMTSDVIIAPISSKYKYKFWGFNKRTPGPFIRVRVGDILDFTLLNKDDTGMAHNVDFHAVTGPGGGAGVSLAQSEGRAHSAFRMLWPGLFVYHCAAAPVPMHVANGMYGLILVEPEGGLPPVDKEFYVMQSEYYYDAPDKVTPEDNLVDFSYSAALAEHPESVVFNGKEGAMLEKPLKAKVGQKLRIFFGNGGPNLISSFHVIGAIFDKVYREGDLISPPARGIQTTLVAPGGSTVVELTPTVPGNLTLVDHAICRLDKGCVGFISVSGKPRKDVYTSFTEKAKA